MRSFSNGFKRSTDSAATAELEVPPEVLVAGARQLTPPLLSASRLRVYLVILCLTFFSVPLGLRTGEITPLSIVLIILGFGLFPAARFGFFLAITTIVFANTLRNLMLLDEKPDIIQYFRQIVPFIFMIFVLSNYVSIVDFVDTLLQTAQVRDRWKLFRRVSYICTLGGILQIILTFGGFPLVNSIFFGATNVGRVYVYPNTIYLFILLFGLKDKNITLIALSSVIVAVTGSKTILASAVTIYVLHSIFGRQIRSALIISIVAASAVVSIHAVYPINAIDRLTEYSSDSDFSDESRQWEIDYAKAHFTQDAASMAFGVGILTTLTPGVNTPDERWNSNSRYDIENVYWALLAKVGIVGSLMILGCILTLGIGLIEVSIIAILLISGFGTSFFFFSSFEGVYLVLSGCVLKAILSFAPRGGPRRRTGGREPARTMEPELGVAP